MPPVPYFQRSLAATSRKNAKHKMLQLRMGKRMGFEDSLVKLLHDVSTKVMSATRLNIHENVLEYDQERSENVLLF